MAEILPAGIRNRNLERSQPRKFKIAKQYLLLNVDSNDIGLVTIVEKEKLIGFNIMAGGGMGTTHGNEATYPRLGSLLGFVQQIE